MEGPLAEPKDAIEERKRQDKDAVEQSRRDFEAARDGIDGNPQVVEALNALEERIEQLEDRVL